MGAQSLSNSISRGGFGARPEDLVQALTLLWRRSPGMRSDEPQSTQGMSFFAALRLLRVLCGANAVGRCEHDGSLLNGTNVL